MTSLAYTTEGLPMVWEVRDLSLFSRRKHQMATQNNSTPIAINSSALLEAIASWKQYQTPFRGVELLRELGVPEWGPAYLRSARVKALMGFAPQEEQAEAFSAFLASPGEWEDLETLLRGAFGQALVEELGKTLDRPLGLILRGVSRETGVQFELIPTAEERLHVLETMLEGGKDVSFLSDVGLDVVIHGGAEDLQRDLISDLLEASGLRLDDGRVACVEDARQRFAEYAVSHLGPDYVREMNLRQIAVRLMGPGAAEEANLALLAEVVQGCEGALGYRYSGELGTRMSAALNRAGILLGTHHEVVVRLECVHEDGPRAEGNKGDMYCFRCGKPYMEVKEIRKIWAPTQVEVAEEPAKLPCLRMECEGGHSIHVAQGSGIKFCSECGTAWKQVEFPDSQGNTYPSETSRDRGESFGLWADKAFQDLLDELTANDLAVWDSRKACRKAVQGFSHSLLWRLASDFIADVPAVKNGLKTRLGTVASGVSRLVQGMVSIILGIGPKDALKVAGKAQGLQTKIAAITAQIEVTVEAAIAGDMDLAVESFSRGFVLGLEIGSVVSHVLGAENPDAEMLSALRGKGFKGRQIYAAIVAVADWAKAAHL